MQFFKNILARLAGKSHVETRRTPLQVVARRDIQSQEGSTSTATGNPVAKRIARVRPGADHYIINLE